MFGSAAQDVWMGWTAHGAGWTCYPLPLSIHACSNPSPFHRSVGLSLELLKSLKLLDEVWMGWTAQRVAQDGQALSLSLSLCLSRSSRLLFPRLPSALQLLKLLELRYRLSRSSLPHSLTFLYCFCSHFRTLIQIFSHAPRTSWTFDFTTHLVPRYLKHQRDVWRIYRWTRCCLLATS